MASLNLASEELRAIEASRNRLFQLTNSLGSLRNNVLSGNPLPSQESLRSSAFILQKNLDSIQQIMNENAALFQRLVVHPSTNFPGRTQEHILLALLRKKLEPEIADWYEEGRKTAVAAGIDPSKLGGGRGHDDDYYGDDDDDYKGDGEEGSEPLVELWEDAREACQERIAHYIRNESSQPYTAAERALGIENVRTGLNRNLDEDSDDEEEEEEDDDVMMIDPPGGGGQQPAGLAGSGGDGKTGGMETDHLQWFGARGDLNVPAYIEMQSQNGGKDTKKKPIGMSPIAAGP